VRGIALCPCTGFACNLIPLFQRHSGGSLSWFDCRFANLAGTDIFSRFEEPGKLTSLQSK
jgi:hypothetical protein